MSTVANDIREHIFSSVRALRRHRGLTSDEAAGVIRVEVTREAVQAIGASTNVQDMIAANEDTNDLRRVFMRGYGRFSFCGVSCYVVDDDAIGGGDSWRVINALGTR